MAEQLVVTLRTIDASQIEEIKPIWQALEAKAKNSIFTSWYWMETWLAFINYQTQLLQVSFHGEIVGLGFLNKYTYKNYGIEFKQLWLNRTGDNEQDQIWNEYNDILCEEGHEYAIRAAILNYFEQQLTEYDEFIIGVSNASIVETPYSNNLMQLATWETTSYHTTLNENVADINSYLKTLSANSRAQIKRTAKLLGGIDKISLSHAQNTEEALEFLQAAGKLHKIRWENQNSGFENPHFIHFHQQFIQQHFNNRIIDLVRIHVDNKTICYLYNFTYKSSVYFYLSGIEYSQDNRFKPGMLSHSLAITDYAKQGYQVYDFMGGEGRYKKSLSNSSGTMIISNYRRKKPAFIASHLLRKLKKAIA